MKWPSWFRRKAFAKPPSFAACPKCGREMEMIEKDTMSGDDLRTYRCEACGEEHVINYGTAL